MCNCAKKTPSGSTGMIFSSTHSFMNSVTNLQEDAESQKDKEARVNKCCWRILIDGSIVILTIVTILLVELSVIPGHKYGFHCNDPSLSYQYLGETVPPVVLLMPVLVAPPLIIFITELIYCSHKNTPLSRNIIEDAGRITASILRAYFYCIILNLIVVELMKVITGTPRPTFFALCAPDTANNCTGSEYIASFTCTSDYSTMRKMDSYRSFPSGHASLSVYAALFLVCYLQHRAFNWSNRTIFTASLLQLVCITFAIICSMSRITDHVHHWWDVLAGAIIGIVMVYFAIVPVGKKFECTTTYSSFNKHLETKEASLERGL